MKELKGGLNWNALVPCGGAVPLITALLSRLNFVLVTVMVAVVVMPTGVATKWISL